MTILEQTGIIAAILAFLGALTTGWDKVRSFLLRGAEIFLVRVACEGTLVNAANHFLMTRLPSRKLGSKTYYGIWKWVYSAQVPEVRVVAYENRNKGLRLYWRNRRPLWFNHDNGSLWFLRGTFVLEDLLQEFALAYTSKPVASVSRFRIERLRGRSKKNLMEMAAKAQGGESASSTPSLVSHDPTFDRPLGYVPSDFEPKDSIKKSAVGQLSLTPEVERTVEDIHRWYKSKDWYRQRGISWKRGVLLYGKPGTGKSSLALALARDLEIPIYVLDISTMDNDEFQHSYKEATENSPALVLIEDIDAVFHGRENVASEAGMGLTFDCFLNTLSGVGNSSGVLLVVTTNNLEHIDPALGVPQPGALSSRPGRIDQAVELPVLTEAGRRQLAQKILKGTHESWIEHMVKIGAGDTGAQFEDRCATQALKLYWSKDPMQPAPMPLKEAA